MQDRIISQTKGYLTIPWYEIPSYGHGVERNISVHTPDSTKATAYCVLGNDTMIGANKSQDSLQDVMAVYVHCVIRPFAFHLDGRRGTVFVFFSKTITKKPTLDKHHSRCFRLFKYMIPALLSEKKTLKAFLRLPLSLTELTLAPEQKTPHTIFT